MTSAKSTSSRLATALLCGENGLRVIPMHGTKNDRCTCDVKDCKQPGRHPRIDIATSKPAMIKKHWTKWPKAKIALATGAPDIIALTVTGNEALEALKKRGTPEKTVKFRADDSRTYLFKSPIDAIPDGTVRIAKGIIVSGRGEYVILPNDLKVAKERRHFVSDRGVGQVDIAAAPEWLVASLRPHVLGIRARPPSPGAQKVRFKTVTVDLNCIVDGNDPCDPEEVKRRAASISETGARMPPAVRLDGSFRDDLPLYAVLTDRCQIEALKSLGASHVECIVVDADEGGAVLWRLAELFHQPRKTVLERAELAKQCVEIVRQKVGQSARPRGGRQPTDKGLGTAERILGVSRRDLGRLLKIAGIQPKAKEEARRAGLDDNQNALLEIAGGPVGKQVERVRELNEQYADGRRKPSATTNSKNSAESSAAGPKKKRVPVDDESDKSEPEPERSRDPSDTEDEGDAEANTPGSANGSTDRAEDDAEDTQDGANSPPIVPEDDGLGIPTFLRRADDEKIKVKLRSIYEKYLAPEWPSVLPAVRHWFVTELLGVAIFNIGKKENSR
jgi:Bifunctional DNA primase/polymerase, N-terminal